MAKFLGQTDLVYLWGKIKTYVANAIAALNLSETYVAKESGKGLSTNDYTTAEKNKLNGIAAGAEVNVQSNWAETDSSEDSYIKNKPTIPSKTSQLQNDSGFITGADVPEGAAASNTTPLMDGTAATGSETAFARGDHRHPSDTTKQDVINDLSDIRAGAAKGATAYQKSSNGVPKSDLAQSVQDSLDLADSAVQSSELPQVTTTTPKMNGTAAIGSENKWAKGDHVHPTDTSRAPLASPEFTGTPKAPTAAAGTNNTQVATTAFVKNAVDGITPESLGVVESSEKGVANGVATLDSNGKVPSSQLPSYVDDVVEAYIRSGQTALSQNWLATGSASGTVITPESGVIYVLMNSSNDYPVNTQFRWGGTSYVKLNDGGISEMTTAEMDTATNNWT